MVHCPASSNNSSDQAEACLQRDLRIPFEGAEAESTIQTMPLSQSMKEYCEALFKNLESELLEKREQQREHVKGGLIGREDAEQRMGPYAYTDVEVSFLKSAAEARKECLCAAYELKGDSLTPAIIDEILLDIGFLIEGHWTVFTAEEKAEYEDIVRRRGEISPAAETRLAEVNRRLDRAAIDIKRRIGNELIVTMHEKTNVAQRTGALNATTNIYDVFVSHATEDNSYVEPLVMALEDAGVRVWLDQTVLGWGDDLRTAIDRGLTNCRYGIVVFSRAFLRKKKWTEYELNGLFAREKAGEKVILPIWHGITHDDLAEYSPTFADRLAKVSSRDNYADIVGSLLALLGRAKPPVVSDQAVADKRVTILAHPEPTPNTIAYADHAIGEDGLKKAAGDQSSAPVPLPLQLKIRERLYFAIAEFVDQTKVLVRDIGMHAFRVGTEMGSSQLFLSRVCRARLSHVSGSPFPKSHKGWDKGWRKGEGVVGLCWQREEDVKLDLTSPLYISVTTLDWRRLTREQRFNLSFDRFTESTKHFCAIFAVPVKYNDEVIGCLSMNIDKNNAALPIEELWSKAQPIMRHAASELVELLRL